MMVYISRSKVDVELLVDVEVLVDVVEVVDAVLSGAGWFGRASWLRLWLRRVVEPYV